MDLIDKYLPEGKKKKDTIIIDRNIMDRKKAFRIPTAPKGQVFKDKKKYTRKKKHKKSYNEESM